MQHGVTENLSHGLGIEAAANDHQVWPILSYPFIYYLESRAHRGPLGAPAEFSPRPRRRTFRYDEKFAEPLRLFREVLDAAGSPIAGRSAGAGSKDWSREYQPARGWLLAPTRSARNCERRTLPASSRSGSCTNSMLRGRL